MRCCPEFYTFVYTSTLGGTVTASQELEALRGSGTFMFTTELSHSRPLAEPPFPPDPPSAWKATSSVVSLFSDGEEGQFSEALGAEAVRRLEELGG